MKKIISLIFLIFAISSCKEKTEIDKIDSMLFTYVQNHCEKIEKNYDPIKTIPIDSVFEIDMSKIDALASLQSMAVTKNMDVNFRNVDARGKFAGILYKQTYNYKNEYGNKKEGTFFILPNKDFTDHIFVAIDYDQISNEYPNYELVKIK